MRRLAVACAGLVAMALCGCPKDDDDALTLGEAAEALSEATVSSQAEGLASSTVEINTNFTIGAAIEAAAQELRDFYATQLPCAEVTLSQGTLTVKYGAKSGNCTYNGQTFTGESTVSIKANAAAEVAVDHTWTNLSNGVITVTGSAHVTWSLADKTRHVQHTLSWKRSDNKTGDGSGDRTQALLTGGVGFKVDGSRTWKGSSSGQWDLAIQGVEMRWADPVPQTGKYVLATPKSKSLTLSFQRVDADTIRVSITNGSKTFNFNVNKTGAGTSAD